MRVIHLIDSDGVYGAERVLLYLAREQQRQGDEPFVASIRPPETGETELEKLAASWGLPVIPIRLRSTLSPQVVRSLLVTIRSYQPDVLHSHGYKANILLGPLPHRWRGAMLTTLHGWAGGRALSSLWLREQLDRWALRCIESVVVVTREMLKLPAVHSIRPDRVRLIENAIPPLAARISDLAASGTADLPVRLIESVRENPTLVAIGRLSSEKGFRLLIQAFAIANARSVNAHRLLIIGEGSERSALETCISELGVQDTVQLAGYVEGADRLLQHAAGFVMSSYTEGMPLVLLEALQWPVPILATAVGAIPELLGRLARGHVVPPRDVAAFADALEVVMSSRRLGPGNEHQFPAAVRTSADMAAEYSLAYQRIA